jgi:FeS assembly SUF system regulator
MLKINKLTDYAIVVLAEIAGIALRTGREAIASVQELSDQTKLPAPTVSKILKRLACGGIAVSERGKHGGYRLARKACEISLIDVINAMEGPIAITECAEASAVPCCYAGSCAVEKNWIRINNAVKKALSGISIADMSSPSALALTSLRPSRGDAAPRDPEPSHVGMKSATRF